jgi:polyisoprenoid-binding protein YceI
MRSPIWAATAGVVALAAALARWLLQGSGNVYTATTKRFYVPDPDLGWRVADGGPVWIGLEAIALIAAVVAGVAFAGWLLGRWERRRSRRAATLRVALWIAATAPLALPAWAFSSGLGPARGVEQLPAGATAAAPTAGIEGALELPAGRYEIVPHAGTSVTARVSAGKETFEARFGKGITGNWTAAPGDLTQPTTAEIQLDPTTVDTGIALRSQHAREDYLQAATYPRITLRLGRLIAARQDGPAQIAFRAEGTIDFLGEPIVAEITGNLRAPDAAGRQRLGFAPGDAVALVDADLAVTVGGTRLRGDADSFDSDRIPIHVSLVLIRRTP